LTIRSHNRTCSCYDGLQLSKIKAAGSLLWAIS
jgi:hypothetical protein